MLNQTLPNWRRIVNEFTRCMGIMNNQQFLSVTLSVICTTWCYYTINTEVVLCIYSSACLSVCLSICLLTLTLSLSLSLYLFSLYLSLSISLSHTHTHAHKHRHTHTHNQTSTFTRTHIYLFF